MALNKEQEAWLEKIEKHDVEFTIVPQELVTEEFCIAAVQKNRYVLEYVSDALITEEFCLAVVQQNGYALEFVPDALKAKVKSALGIDDDDGSNNDDDGPKCGTKAESTVHGTDSINTSKEQSMELNKEQKTWLKKIEEAAGEEDVMALLEEIFDKMPKELLTEKFYIAAVTITTNVVFYIPESLGTEAIYLTAVNNQGKALESVPKNMKTEAVCLAAVEKNPSMLQYVPEEVMTEKVCLAALEQYPGAIKWVPEDLKKVFLERAGIDEDDIVDDYNEDWDTM